MCEIGFKVVYKKEIQELLTTGNEINIDRNILDNFIKYKFLFIECILSTIILQVKTNKAK